MARGTTASVAEPSASRAGSTETLIQTKLEVPVSRPGTIVRDALVERLVASADLASVVAVFAPPGYGKTTLLVQWGERERRGVGWVLLDDRDNDPVVFLTYVAAALDRIEPIDPEIFRLLDSPRISATTSIVPRIRAAMSSMRPFLLVLDEAHWVHEPECLDSLAGLLTHLPAGSQIAVAGRGEPRLPLPRIRSQGHLLELGPSDLALSPSEAAVLLQRAGLDLSPDDVLALVRRTEGWAAGLYLAALSLRGNTPGHSAATFGGDDRFVADFLWAELLTTLPRKEIRFMTRTSVLEQMSGPLCDAVLGSTGSARTLEAIERSNLLLTPLDRRREWYRYHLLFREFLQSELGRREPDLIPELHRRAADWYLATGSPESAVEHLHLAGDVERLAQLVVSLTLPLYRRGRWATVDRWLEWFERDDLENVNVPVAVMSAWIHVMNGRPADAERWLAAAEGGSYDRPMPDGSTSVVPWIAPIRSTMCRDGIEQMRQDALAALEQMPPAGIWRSPAILSDGVALLLLGERDRADERLAAAVDVADESGAWPSLGIALAERALVAIDRAAWAEAEDHAVRSAEVIEANHLEDHSPSALTFAVLARLALHRRDRETATQRLTQTERLRPFLSYAVPWYAVQVQTELAQVCLALGDAAAARMLLGEATEVLRRRPDLGTLGDRIEDLRRKVEGMPVAKVGSTALTTAELRLLPLLATYHTFREIGERLFISPNTVKSEAISIYRKLGVSSRSAAIDRATEIGLLEA